MHPAVLLPLPCCTCLCVMHTPMRRLCIFSFVIHAPSGPSTAPMLHCLCVMHTPMHRLCIFSCVIHAPSGPSTAPVLHLFLCDAYTHAPTLHCLLCDSCTQGSILSLQCCTCLCAMHAPSGPPTAYILHLLVCDALHFMLCALAVVCDACIQRSSYRLHFAFACV